MIDASIGRVHSAAAHFVGNKVNGEELRISAQLLPTKEHDVRALLLKFFTEAFREPVFYRFTFSSNEVEMNTVYQYCSRIFDASEKLLAVSEDMARYLFDCSTHPQIKGGDLIVGYLQNMSIQGKSCDAIAIFKSENRQDFLHLTEAGKGYEVKCESGINPEKIDKACLVFNVDKADGYQVCIIDKSNRNDAQYWKDTFLRLENCSDAFHHTREFMNLTRAYVTKQFQEEFVVEKTDQIELLNRSMDYFKTNEAFNIKSFEDEVLQDKAIIKSFRSFDEQYQQDNNVQIEDKFDISLQAVKKQQRVFKSVLKLDKNFHIYIHGNRELIEKGEDNDGRKFYKIYYTEEN